MIEHDCYTKRLQCLVAKCLQCLLANLPGGETTINLPPFPPTGGPSQRICKTFFVVLLRTYQWFAPGWGGGGNPWEIDIKACSLGGDFDRKIPTYSVIGTNYKGLTSGEHPGEGNLRFSSQKSQIRLGLPPLPHPGANH